MPDCLLEYLCRCKGRDVLVFDTEQAARLAHDVLVSQMDADDVAFSRRPAVRVFGSDLHLELPVAKETRHDPAKQVAKAR